MNGKWVSGRARLTHTCRILVLWSSHDRLTMIAGLSPHHHLMVVSLSSHDRLIMIALSAHTPILECREQLREWVNGSLGVHV